jgi:uncharacterized protein (TIGR03032 family)
METPTQTVTPSTAVAIGTVSYSLSGGLLARLASLEVSLAFTSYQSSYLYMLGIGPDGGAQLHQSEMPKPMGLACDDQGQMVLATGSLIIRFENILEPGQRINQVYDGCFMPRTQHVTGQLDAHDVGILADGAIIFVNTRYNCLATISQRHSFKPVWKPHFITDIIDEDRCHLNGLAMRDGEPAYVTAVSRSNTIDGWRDRRAEGGVVIDVQHNAVVCEGLSMPHSPRWHDGRLYVLNAGTGDFGWVDFGANSAGGSSSQPAMGVFRPIAFCPGFLRGLAFAGQYAFIGLSRPRYQRFEGLDLDRRLIESDSEAWCGVQVIDIETGHCTDWFRIDGDVGELYDVELVSEFACPMAVSPHSPDAAALVTIEQN